MADLVKRKPPVKSGPTGSPSASGPSVRVRNPSDEMDPETGMPYSDIPGVEYPEEFALGENLAIGAATGGGGNLIRTAVEQGAKKAVGKAVAGEAKDLYNQRVSTVAQDARQNANSALGKVKANMPNKEAIRAEAIRNPGFNEKLHLDPDTAIEGLRAQNTGSLRANQSLKNTKELGTNLPEDKSGVAYSDKLNSAPIGGAPPKTKQGFEGNYTDALKEKPRSGFHESDSTSPPLDYKNLNRPKPPRK